MMNDAPLLKAIRDKAMIYCSRKEYCTSEIRKKILSWGCPPEEAVSVIDYLVENQYLDNRRYTEAYVNDKLRFAKWGRIKINYMLQMQGVEKDIIKETLADIDEHQYQQRLQDELTKKRKSIKAAQPAEVYAKLYRFAAGRGFEPNIIHSIIQHAVESKK
ncbi:MAG: RecX family transcriptional regulator [Bacteroidales bacterium]|jgi:regulatory protein|nr:RecX family transcriptional regulator [Bacteroidales bacterium]